MVVGATPLAPALPVGEVEPVGVAASSGVADALDVVAVLGADDAGGDDEVGAPGASALHPARLTATAAPTITARRCDLRSRPRSPERMPLSLWHFRRCLTIQRESDDSRTLAGVRWVTHGTSATTKSLRNCS